MRTLALGTLAFVVASFATQATSHFVVNVDHYAKIGILRGEPVMALGFLTMLVQGAVLSFLYSRLTWPPRTMLSALRFSWLMGAYLASYIALAEAAKYSVPSITSWMTVELSASAIQFTLFGILLHLVVRRHEAG